MRSNFFSSSFLLVTLLKINPSSTFVKRSSDLGLSGRCLDSILSSSSMWLMCSEKAICSSTSNTWLFSEGVPLGDLGLDLGELASEVRCEREFGRRRALGVLDPVDSGDIDDVVAGEPSEFLLDR